VFSGPFTGNGLFLPCSTALVPSGVGTVTATGTGACLTADITTKTGNAFRGTLKCTNTTGASTLILNPGVTATNGWTCSASDQTTVADVLVQTTQNATTCTLSGTIAANDVISFSITGSF